MSIVRDNLLKRPGYVPYCGADDCRHRWPRTEFDGSQFKCRCGWRSGYEAEFIAEYKSKMFPEVSKP
jgi:hypothetical protein